MREDEIRSLIDRIVSGARVPRRLAREELRRELQTHFEDAASSPQQVAEAIRSFGDEALIAGAFRRVYWTDYLLAYLGKIAVSILAAAAVALVIEVAVNVRLLTPAGTWRLAPGFPHAAVLSMAVVLAVVAVREGARMPLRALRAAVAAAAFGMVAVLASLVNGAGVFLMALLLASLAFLASAIAGRYLRLLVTLLVFIAVEYGVHLMTAVTFGFGRAFFAGSVLMAVCAATGFVASHLDRTFVALFEM
jgi:hypothetical protein